MDQKHHIYDAAVIKPIKAIEFGILPNDEIKNERFGRHTWCRSS